MNSDLQLNDLAFRHMPGLAAVIDVNGNVLNMNDEARKAGVQIGQKCYSAFWQCKYLDQEVVNATNNTDRRQELRCSFCLADESLGCMGSIQTEWYDADDDRWFDIHWIPLTENTYLHYAWELTKLRRKERELQRTHDWLQQTQKIGKMGSWHQNFRTNTLLWSEGTHEIFGLDWNKNGIKFEDFLGKVHPEDRERVQKTSQRALDEGEYEIEYRFFRPDGTEGIAHERAEVIRDEYGRATNLMGTVQDITGIREEADKRRVLETGLLKSRQLEILGLMAGGIAHDFNNTFQVIGANVEMLLHEQTDTPDNNNHFADIGRELEKAAELSNKILAYSGKGLFRKTAVDINREVRKTISLLRKVALDGIELKEDISPRAAFVEGDGDQLAQVFKNLIVNAVESCNGRGGLVEVTTSPGVTAEKHDQDFYVVGSIPHGEYVEISVHDNGEGIDPDLKERIFDPFFSTKGAGRGLGLSAAMGIVRAHHGGIKVQSDKHIGTAVTLCLPLAKQPRQAAEERSCTDRINREVKTALVVEDNESVLKMSKLMLENLGFSVLVAKDGESALDIFELQNSDIDLIFLDLTLPGIQGHKVLEEIRQIRADVKVIITSGYAQKSISEDQHLARADAFIQKPYKFAELKKTINH